MLKRLLAAALLCLVPTLALADASIWPSSRVPFIDIDGQPMVGATVEFFNCATSTPQVVYEEGELSNPLLQPIEADERGMFPAIFLSSEPGCYRVRVEDADAALVYDDDDIAVPQTATFTPPDAGETSEELLLRVGMLQPYYGTSAPSGWVRAAGRTIGSASSGATERANADCEDLFVHLWTVDANLTVSGGRGANAAADWAANKTITLPDLRERAIAGLATMGNSDAGIVADTYVTAGTNTSTLGAVAGVDDLTLSEAQLPAHDHDATFTGSALGTHTHTVTALSGAHGANGNASSTFRSSNGDQVDGTDAALTSSATSAGTPAGTIDVQDTGSGSAINNMSPMAYATILIKL